MRDSVNRYRFIATVVCLGVVVLLSGVFCDQKGESETKQAPKATSESAYLSDPRDSLVIELTGVSSQTVFDLLTARHRVMFKSSAQGIFVKEIDSVENSGSHFWVYSVNGESGTVASNAYVTDDGDKVRWHYRRIGD